MVKTLEADPSRVINPADIRFAAMNLLSRREHSSLELRQKLLRRFDDVEAIDEQVTRLTEEGLQCDLRYAESFLRQRVSRGQGPLRIRQDMRQRGVADSLIAAAFKAESPDWDRVVSDVIAKKFGSTAAEELKDKARRVRFLQYRGFSADHYSDKI
jgi:regulatory protein